MILVAFVIRSMYQTAKVLGREVLLSSTISITTTVARISSVYCFDGVQAQLLALGCRFWLQKFRLRVGA